MLLSVPSDAPYNFYKNDCGMEENAFLSLLKEKKNVWTPKGISIMPDQIQRLCQKYDGGVLFYETLLLPDFACEPLEGIRYRNGVGCSRGCLAL